MDKEYNIKTNTERVDKEYWIDTEGHIHKFNGDLSEEYVSLHYVICIIYSQTTLILKNT